MLAEPAPSLNQSYRVCGEVVRSRAATFALAARFLAPAKRRAVWAVYAFCRTVDDVADREAPAAERFAVLDDCERRLRAAYDGVAGEPLFVALADAVRRYAIPLEPALDLLRGARLDVAAAPIPDVAALDDYCYLVASTVGLLVLPILGAADADAATPHAVALGRAMQLTNILRDVGEDARMGRVYLPDAELRRFGCDRDAIAAQRLDDRFLSVMCALIARARALYAQAEPGVGLLDADARYPIRLALVLYRAILDRIEANGYDVFTRRAFVPRAAKLRAALAVARPFGVTRTLRSSSSSR